MEQIEKMQKQLKTLPKKDKKDCGCKLKKIKYVGVEFEPSKIEYCEKQVNDALSQGYEPIRDVDTPRGLVLVLGLWQ